MSEILFKGKRLDNGDWVEGGYHKHMETTPPAILPAGEKPEENKYVHLILRDGFSDWCMPKPIEGIPVDPTTVGRFSGLHDRNGKRIWEGDVIRLVMDNGDETTVVCRFGRVVRPIFENTVEITGFYFERASDGKKTFPIIGNYAGKTDYDLFEVIGTIYDKAEATA